MPEFALGVAKSIADSQFAFVVFIRHDGSAMTLAQGPVSTKTISTVLRAYVDFVNDLAKAKYEPVEGIEYCGP